MDSQVFWLKFFFFFGAHPISCMTRNRKIAFRSPEMPATQVELLCVYRWISYTLSDQGMLVILFLLNAYLIIVHQNI